MKVAECQEWYEDAVTETVVGSLKILKRLPLWTEFFQRQIFSTAFINFYSYSSPLMLHSISFPISFNISLCSRMAFFWSFLRKRDRENTVFAHLHFCFLRYNLQAEQNWTYTEMHKIALWILLNFWIDMYKITVFKILQDNVVFATTV